MLVVDRLSGWWRLVSGRDLASSQRLRAAFEEGSSLSVFLELADAAQAELYTALRADYGLDTFAKLLALKLTNLAVAKRLFRSKEPVVFSGPVHLMADPANNCQLSCPGCVHTATEHRAEFDWPGALLSPERHARFMDRLGPTAFGVVYFNYGEPFLNKHTTEFVTAAKSYLLSTVVSSNLNLLRDPEAVVRSGLDCLIVSLDGVTQPVYGRFRRGGKVDVCLDNLRALVEAKRRLASPTPNIIWQYLTFEHNLHEVDAAFKLARQLGVNQLYVSTPFDVGWDDPGIKVAKSPRQGRWTLRDEPSPRYAPARLPEHHPAVDAAFDRSWSRRLADAGEAFGRARAGAAAGAACPWLYQGLTIDALGRIMPCCGAPSVKMRNYVFGQMDEAEDWFNTESYRRSRLAARNRDAYSSAFKGSDHPYCVDCRMNPAPVFGLPNGVTDAVARLDPRRLLRRSLVKFWADW